MKILKFYRPGSGRNTCSLIPKIYIYIGTLDKNFQGNIWIFDKDDFHLVLIVTTIAFWHCFFSTCKSNAYKLKKT